MHGGIPGHAMGGVVFRAAEIGPDVAHFLTGGTVTRPHDGHMTASMLDRP